MVIGLLSNSAALAQTQTVVLARLGMRNAATSHYLEVIPSYGHWIAPDVYYFDFGSKKYREIGAGGGVTGQLSKRFTATQELFFDQAYGSSSHGAMFLVPWSYLGYSITSRIRGETVYFPYFPLNRYGHIEHILERSKVEYYFSHLKLGVGYGGSKIGDRDWQHKPFLTTTFRGGSWGDLEFWLQRIAGNHLQAQIRYRLLSRWKKN